MRLVYRLVLRTLLILFPVMTLWGMLFYHAMIAEVVDETDDRRTTRTASYAARSGATTCRRFPTGLTTSTT